MASSSDTRNDEATPDVDAPITDEERRQAVRLVSLLLAAVLAVVFAAGIGYLVNQDSGDVVFSEDEVELTNAIGPLPGTDLAAYGERRRAEVAEASGTRVAAVSFGEYQTVDGARRLLEPLPVRALLVAPPGGSAAVVTGELSAWVEQARREAAEERAELERLLAEGDLDPNEDREFIEDHRQEVQRLRQLEQGLGADDRLVFGVVVVADAGTLQRIAGSPGVRLVDIGETDEVPDPSRIRGIRPEEQGRAGEPATRPV